MSARIEEYLRPDGVWSPHRRDAIVTTAARVVSAALDTAGKVPPRYFVGTAEHESNFALNERDTEPPKADGTCFQSWGIYQISKGEARDVGVPGADLLALGPATHVMSLLAARNLAAIMDVIMGSPHLHHVPGDAGAYLALAHNQGRRAAVKSIAKYGMDWDAYKGRNPTIRIVTSGYGDACRGS